MSREAFGPTLRRCRLRAGVTLEQIAAESNIALELLVGLEANNLSEWPTGIYARAYVRQYACAIGIDPEETVDEFCRWFPQADRRVRLTVLEHAAIIGHDTTWTDEIPDAVHGVERRGAPPGAVSQPSRTTPSALQMMLGRLRRAFGRA